MKHSFLIVFMGLSIATQGNAGVVLDIDARMASILGHTPKATHLSHGDSFKLNRARAEEQPWSGSYWPDITGGITNHYRDQNGFRAQMRFLFRYGAAQARFKLDHHRVSKNYLKFNQEELDQKLSPSEKYDLLIGNENFEFTRAVMAEIDFRSSYRNVPVRHEVSDREKEKNLGIENKEYFEDQPKVTYKRYDDEVKYRIWRKKGNSLAYWSGICDGWSPAAVYLPRPVKPITMMTPKGKMITFYPDDIKALGTYLYARTNTPYFSSLMYEFVGRSCMDFSSADRDKKGFVKDIRCNDVDAGVFHLTLLNRVGLDRKGFMMEIDNNHKINNHPVAAYEIEYFNPLDGKVGRIQHSVVPISSIQDGYKSRRSAKTTHLVGVKAKVKYVYYVWPEDHKSIANDHEGLDLTETKEYFYDLELDANGKILGGEWGNRFEEKNGKVSEADQPDFLWFAKNDQLPFSEQSQFVIPGMRKDFSNPSPFNNMVWNASTQQPLNSEWIRAAQADQTLEIPQTVKNLKEDEEVMFDAKNDVLKSPQSLSPIVYFLFDQAKK